MFHNMIRIMVFASAFVVCLILAKRKRTKPLITIAVLALLAGKALGGMGWLLLYFAERANVGSQVIMTGIKGLRIMDEFSMLPLDLLLVLSVGQVLKIEPMEKSAE